ncbi:MAG: DUF5670 family protein [Bryobacteraceae bacterium]
MPSGENGCAGQCAPFCRFCGRWGWPPQIAGSLLHLLLVIALVVVVIRLVPGRGIVS